MRAFTSTPSDATRAEPQGPASVETRETKGPAETRRYGSSWAEDSGVHAAVPYARGEILGRYVVVDELGTGGMGVVVSAYDTQLDRRVALKVLHTGAAANHEERQRLRREAQALARLSHPNVVGVYDVGELGGRVFIAMEFVDGPNLREWLRLGTRTWKEVVAVYRGAAKALIAAHAAGIVHRDFKPDNVLLGADGRTRVTDFGLALEADSPAESVADDPAQAYASASEAHLARVTETGTVMGTPAYMPIEQHRGKPSDARSDQFSFCVSLYESLYGVRPFGGTTALERCQSIQRGEIPAGPSERGVPGRIHAVLRRGMRARPEDRFASMSALLRALHPVSRRGSWWAGGAAAVLAGGALFVVMTPAAAKPCEDAGAPMTALWTLTRAGTLRDALQTSDGASGSATAQHIQRGLDDYAARWVGAREDACMDTERGEQSGAALDLRMTCLERRRAAFATALDVLGDSEPDKMRGATDLVARLPSISSCADPGASTRAFPPPADAGLAKEVDALLVAVDRVDALRVMARFDDAEAAVSALQDRIDAADYGPLRARAWMAHGRLHSDAERPADAVKVYVAAYRAALAHRMLEDAAFAAGALIYLNLQYLGDLEEAERWEIHMVGLEAAAGSTAIRAYARNKIALLRAAQGRMAESVDARNEAIDVLRRQVPVDAIALGADLVQLANAHRLRGQTAEAKAVLAEARGLLEEAVGVHHPQYSYVLIAEMHLALVEGDPERARVLSEEALQISAENFGERSVDYAYALMSLATAQRRAGAVDRAVEHLVLARDILIEQLGPEHQNVLGMHNNLAAAYYDQGDLEAARRMMLAVVDGLEAAYHGPHDQRMVAIGNLASVELQLGHRELARERAQESLDMAIELHGEDSSPAADRRFAMGQLLVRAEAPAEAVPLLQAALEGPVESQTFLAEMRYWLARAQVEANLVSGDERARVLEVASDTVATFREADDAELAAEVEAWVAEHLPAEP